MFEVVDVVIKGLNFNLAFVAQFILSKRRALLYVLFAIHLTH